MPEWLIELFGGDPSYYYAVVAVIFVLCGLGLPVPEEIVLVFAGFICFRYPEYAGYPTMTVV